MKKQFLIPAVAAVAFSGLAFASNEADTDAAEAKKIIGEFFSTLKGELQSAMKAGGPVSAITICQERAPEIADSLSEKTGWEVGRTSLKLRNAELNAPDEWERGVLTAFEERKAAGEDVKTMAFSEVVESDGGERYRFMKAIPTGEVCLVCHGETLGPDIAAAIDKAYPADEAKGFELGDIRGAFTLSKPR